MTHPRTTCLAIGLVLVAAIGFSLNAAEQTKKPDSPESSDPKELEAALQRLDLQSAEFGLRIAELDLQRIDDMNRKVANIYSGSEVERFRAAVTNAKERVSAARKVIEGKDACAIVGVAEATVKNAKDAYDRAMGANRRLSTAVSAVEVERLKIALDLANVNLERAKVVDKLNSPVAAALWELDALREEVRQLRIRVSSITSRR